MLQPLGSQPFSMTLLEGAKEWRWDSQSRHQSQAVLWTTLCCRLFASLQPPLPPPLPKNKAPWCKNIPLGLEVEKLGHHSSENAQHCMKYSLSTETGLPGGGYDEEGTGNQFHCPMYGLLFGCCFSSPNKLSFLEASVWPNSHSLSFQSLYPSCFMSK